MMLPVVVVAGLHADARHSVVETLLARVPGSVAVHHDLTAASGTVTRTLRNADGLMGDALPLAGGGSLGALRADMSHVLERLAAGGRCPLAVVEVWDSLQPQLVAEWIATDAGETLSLVGVATAVDPALVLACLTNGDGLTEAGFAATRGDRRTLSLTFARQLEYAPVLVLVAGPEEAARVDRELVARLHPTARLIDVRDPGLVGEVTAGFDVSAAAARQHPACALLPQATEDGEVTTFVWGVRRPFHPGRLYAALAGLTRLAIRSRGRFWLADRPDTMLAWDAAGGVLCLDEAGPWLAALPDAAWDGVAPERRAAAGLDWHPEHGDRGQRLVFVSPALDTARLSAVLRSCLLDDREYAAGPGLWVTFASAFDQVLAPAH
jgi:G3E family GTPase